MKRTTLLTLAALLTGITALTVACKKNDTPTPSGTKYFAAVKAIVTTHCVGCHSGATPSGGVDLNTDPNIAAKATRIKARAVDDLTASSMPLGSPKLSTAQKTTITNWVAAGGRITD